MDTPRLTLPPAATPAQFLRLFCEPEARLCPALACPWTGPGKSGGLVTAASDGETACVWTVAKLGPFMDWQKLSAFGDRSASPLQRFRPLLRPVGITPLGLIAPVKGATCYEIHILGSVAYLSARHVWALMHADACHFGHSSLPVISYRHQALSVRAVVGSVLFYGVIHCLPTPDFNQPATPCLTPPQTPNPAQSSRRPSRKAGDTSPLTRDPLPEILSGISG